MNIVSRRTLTALILLGMLLCACAGREVLVSKSATAPPGLDLSGIWTLRDEQAASGNVEQPDPARRANRAALVHVFMEKGRRLKLTQTEHGLFVSFNRSIVEEYRFGENRIVSVGEIQASRVSGWENDNYVIETLTDDGYKLVERYGLENNGASLVRTVAISRRDKPHSRFVQKYDRKT
jgi:hypothetical protein